MGAVLVPQVRVQRLYVEHVTVPHFREEAAEMGRLRPFERLQQHTAEQTISLAPCELQQRTAEQMTTSMTPGFSPPLTTTYGHVAMEGFFTIFSVCRW